MRCVATASTWTRFVLAMVCVTGTIGFSAACLATFVARPRIEREARAFLVREVEREAKAYLGGVLSRHASLRDHASVLAQRLDGEVAELQALRDSRLPEAIGAMIAEHCETGCEQVKARVADAYGASVRDMAKRVIARTSDRLGGLKTFVIGKYQAMLSRLLHELRIFTGINASLFACTSAVLWWHRRAMQCVLVPAALLTTASCISVWFYLNAQNWLWTVLLSDYVGWWYIAWVAAVGAMLADIVLNRARVTTAIVSSLPAGFVPSC